MLMTTNQPIFLQAMWNAPANIRTCITTSVNDFNIASHVNDDPLKVASNRVKLDEILPASPLWLNQTHSTEAVRYSTSSSSTPNADAIYSEEVGKPCLVMTADCLPILLTNQRGDFVAPALDRPDPDRAGPGRGPWSLPCCRRNRSRGCHRRGYGNRATGAVGPSCCGHRRPRSRRGQRSR